LELDGDIYPPFVNKHRNFILKKEGIEVVRCPYSEYSQVDDKVEYFRKKLSL
jgi:hypothetical protein